MGSWGVMGHESDSEYSARNGPHVREKRSGVPQKTVHQSGVGRTVCQYGATHRQVAIPYVQEPLFSDGFNDVQYLHPAFFTDQRALADAGHTRHLRVAIAFL